MTESKITLRDFTFRSALCELWERAEGSMDADSLEWFSQASEEAESMTNRLASVIEGIGCLVADDDGSLKTAGFQGNRSTADLLIFIGQSLTCIQALISIGSDASYQLRKQAQKGGAQ